MRHAGYTLYLLTLLMTTNIISTTHGRPSALTAILMRAANEPNGGKRAPSVGFMGLRGKKWEDDAFAAESDADQLYKRTLSGFMGLRGKKGNDFDRYEKKIVPSGFVGLRGKKRISYPFGRAAKNDFGDKRAPMAFMGMRGKKSILDEKRIPSGFYGLRG